MTGTEQKRNIPELRFPEFEGEWVEKRLEKLFSEFKSGKNITASQIKEEGKYPVYGGNGLRGYFDDYTHDGEYFLIGRQGALCGNINKSVGKAYFSEHAIACKANGQNDTEWLSQRLQYYNLNRLSESSAQPGLSVNKLLRFKLVVPEKSEQTKIANFLTAVDKRINLLQKKKAELEQYKKGVMQKLFDVKTGDRPSLRFKQDDGSDFPDWEEKKLGEVCEKQSSNISANSLSKNNGVYKIYGATGFLQNVDFYREEEPYISIVKDGAGVGRTLLCEAKSSVLGTLDIIKPKGENNLEFLYSLINQIHFQKYITGSTIPHIYFKDYSKERIKIPTSKEQTKIANFLSSIDKSIEILENQIEQSQQWKKGLLQKMFV